MRLLFIFAITAVLLGGCEKHIEEAETQPLESTQVAIHAHSLLETIA